MNYLIIEGFQAAAAKFAKEANINPQIDLESIEDRVKIRNAILEGDIEAAVRMINDLDPEVCFLNAFPFLLVSAKLVHIYFSFNCYD